MRDAPDIGDVFPLQGDADRLLKPNSANRWGSRFLLSSNRTFPGGRFGQQTFVDTPVFENPRLFYVQVRFANAVLNGGSTTPNPVLPFQSNSNDRIRFLVRRQLDDYGGLITDEYIVNGFAPTEIETFWFPLGVIAARKLQILAEDIDVAPGHGAQYVDVAVALTSSIDDQLIIAERTSLVGSNIFGYANTQVRRVAATGAAPVVLLPADSSRRQIFITNEGSTRLALRFSGFDSPNVTPGTEDWDIILDAKGGAFTRYISAMDTYWGRVEGLWEGAPGGFAMCSGSSVS